MFEFSRLIERTENNGEQDVSGSQLQVCLD
jgi:hypothetical protein